MDKIPAIHRRQFILAEKPYLREDFFCVQLGDGPLVLSYQKDLKVKVLHNGVGGDVLLLGNAYQCDPSKSSPEEELEKSDDLSLESLLHRSSTFSGRWLLITEKLIIADVCATIPVFYNGDCVTSSPALLRDSGADLEEEEGLPSLKRGLLPDWYIAPKTKYKGLLRMLPSEHLEIHGGTFRRTSHNPFCKYKLSPPEILSRMTVYFDCFFKNAGKEFRDIVIPFTAGGDSRTLVALAKHSGIKFRTVTLTTETNKSDFTVPVEISRRCSIPHSIIPKGTADKKLLDLWDKHCSGCCISPDRDFFAEGQFEKGFSKDSLLLRGNIWEVASFYWTWRYPETGKGDADKICELITAAFPSIRESRFQHSSLHEWAESISSNPYMDWRDAFYYEQRQSAWLGYNYTGCDLADFTQIAPICSSCLISLALSLPDEMRMDKNFQKLIVNKFLPECTDIPYNKVSSTEKVRSMWKKLKGLRSYNQLKYALIHRLGRQR